MAKGSANSRKRLQANGAIVGTTPSATAAAVSTDKEPTLPSRQTDGAYIPVSGPITNVRQLMRGPNTAKGSIGSFTTLAAYVEHLNKLTAAQLYQHAVEDARVTPIDDRARLIRRLENNWTEVAARELSSQGKSPAPKRGSFTPEQVKAQEELRRKMLGGRA